MYARRHGGLDLPLVSHLVLEPAPRLSVGPQKCVEKQPRTVHLKGLVLVAIFILSFLAIFIICIVFSHFLGDDVAVTVVHFFSLSFNRFLPLLLLLQAFFEGRNRLNHLFVHAIVWIGKELEKW